MSEQQPSVRSKDSNNPPQPESKPSPNIQIADSNAFSHSETETDQDQDQNQNHDSKSSHNDSSDDNKSNMNHNPSTTTTTWNCTKCTLENSHRGILCIMCNSSRVNYSQIHSTTWDNILTFNTNNLTEIPQWIKCHLCNEWRTIQISISIIKTWTPPINYICSQSNGEFQCKKKGRIPSNATHSSFEIFALSIQRCLAYLQNKITPQNIKNLNNVIQNEKEMRRKKLQLNKSDTIIIDDQNDTESETEHENEREKSSSPNGWNCIKCTFKNQHLGNLCAMCDEPKPGSTVTKISDEQYAKLLHKSFEEGRDISITPDIERMQVQGSNNNNNNNKSMSVDSNNVMNGHISSSFPSNTEIGPFGAITCVNNGRRIYLLRDKNDMSKLEWSMHPPKSAQSWVRQRFGDHIISSLPKMNRQQRQQIERLHGNGHYINNNNYTFDDSHGHKIDLISSENSDNDIQIIDIKKDEQYAMRLQALFDNDDQTKVNNNNNNNIQIKNGEIIHKRSKFNKQEEDSTDFDFRYDGMHAKDEYASIDITGENNNNSNNNEEQSVQNMLNMGLRQANVEPLDDIDGMSITLFDHQKKGVAWMLQMENDRKCRGGFLCDQMGVGKTIQIIALMLKSKENMFLEAEKKYKEDGYISESDYNDSVDSNDDTCGGFVVNDNIIDFQSDNENNNNNNNTNNRNDDDDNWFPNMDDSENDNNNNGGGGGGNGNDDETEDEWHVGMEQDDNSNSNNNNKNENDDWYPGKISDEDNNNKNDKNNDNDNWYPGKISDDENNSNKPLARRGKKRKYSEVNGNNNNDYDSDRTLDEDEVKQVNGKNEILCLNDLNNGNNNNNNNSLGSDSPFVLNDDDDNNMSSSPDLVDNLINRMKNKKNKKKRRKKKQLEDYFPPNKKRRKLNNGNKKIKKKIIKSQKKKPKNRLYENWLLENGFSAKKKGKISSYKPWLSLKQRTLIIGPLAILDQWAEEIKDKTTKKQFKICIYHGAGRKKKYNKYTLKKYDVIITTFGHISSEYAKGNEEKQDGLFKLPSEFFYRVVLDEAHTIKNPSSQQSKACACIGNNGVSVRWCLTGTPIQNKLLDLFPLCRFLQIKQCGTAKDFKTFLKLGNDKNTVIRGRSKQLITSFLAAHMLRRLKDEVVDDLVSKTEEVIELQFDEAEDHVYKAFQNHARSRFNKFVQAGTAKKNYAHILVLLLRLRQICDHPFLAMKIQDGQSESVGGDGDSDSDNNMNMDDGKNGGDSLEKIDKKIIKRINELRDSILDSECPICLDVYTDGIMFRECGHFICKEHLYDLDEKCPLCRSAFRANKVISFNVIIKSALIDEKHKKSLLANDGKDGLIMDGNVVAEKMGNVSNNNGHEIRAATRRIVWRKVSKAKGIFRSIEQIEEEKEQKNNNNSENNSQNEDVKNKLKKMQEKFDWNTYIIDEKYDAKFNDDDENGYQECDKYPNEEYGWKFIPSSKTKMMMQKIQNIRQTKPNDKIIIFSQFTTMLKILERVLNKYDIKYLMYDGSKTRQQRKDIISTFKKDIINNNIPVMIMSLKCAALGLNLTVANHVIFCDLWWNPAIESQAIDRVHRIGQEKHVFITRMIIKDSVEERILTLQRDKQKIADSTLDGANFVKRNGLSVRDLAMLFGSDENIMELASRQSGQSGFSRNSLMNVRSRPNFNHNHNNHNNHGQQVPQHQYMNFNHNHNNHNNHNHNHNNYGQQIPQHQYMNFNDPYINSLDANTRAAIARIQNGQ